MTLSRVLQAMARWSNPVTRWILSRRLHGVMSGRLLLVSFTGRKTGRSYVTPVSYVREGSRLLIPGGGAWWKNLGDSPVRVRLRGTWRTASSEVITDPEALSETLARMMAANPALSVFTGIGLGADGRPARASFDIARRRGFVVVQLDVQGQTAPSGTGHPSDAVAARSSFRAADAQ